MVSGCPGGTANGIEKAQNRLGRFVFFVFLFLSFLNFFVFFFALYLKSTKCFCKKAA